MAVPDAAAKPLTPLRAGDHLVHGGLGTGDILPLAAAPVTAAALLAHTPLIQVAPVALPMADPLAVVVAAVPPFPLRGVPPRFRL